MYTKQQEFPYPHAEYVFHVQKQLSSLACVCVKLWLVSVGNTTMKCLMPINYDMYYARK